MLFKNLAEEMTEKDLKEVLEIIYPDTIFSGYKRMERDFEHIRLSSSTIRIVNKLRMQGDSI